MSGCGMGHTQINIRSQTRNHIRVIGMTERETIRSNTNMKREQRATESRVDKKWMCIIVPIHPDACIDAQHTNCIESKQK